MVFISATAGIILPAIVDVAAIAEYASKLPHVVVSKDYKYMCSDPGQEIIQKDIQEFNLNRIVVASCSPLLHEATFRSATEKAGLNQFYMQMVNIRENVSWVHEDKVMATFKAKDLVRAAIHRVAFHKALEKKKVPGQPGCYDRRRRYCRDYRSA